MFVCSFCKQVTKPKAKCNKIVTKSVRFNHPHRSRVLKRWGVDKQGKKKLEWVDDRGGVGLQIVKEINVCTDCADQYSRNKESSTKLESVSVKSLLKIGS